MSKQNVNDTENTGVKREKAVRKNEKISKNT